MQVVRYNCQEWQATDEAVRPDWVSMIEEGYTVENGIVVTSMTMV